ncbi:MAG: DNA methyltransferase [Planctomycetota bacterium]|nr:DNA methyltransferase [Planctomycetota bacterium]
METYARDNVKIFHGDVLDLYAGWPSPIVIISDGPYGLGSFPGDPPTPHALADWYRPHIEKWSSHATPQTTLWFWNSELGWANVHHLFEENDWEYRNCHIWDKGIAHVAGNSNGKTLRKFPVTTEVCVQYTRNAFFKFQGTLLPMKEWLRAEWERTGLPLYQTNEACGVRNAATRKYFTRDHLWYYPPPEAFERLVKYANRCGDKEGRPYFSIDGKRPITRDEWSKMRAKFNFENGITNVWHANAVRGSERLKRSSKCVHMNQKPLSLIELCIRASSDPDDVVWEPFGGLCSVAFACYRLERECYAAEINREFFEAAKSRLEHYDEIFQSKTFASAT